MAESKMAEFKMDAEFKIAAIIKLTENERVKFFYANGGNQSWQLWMSLKRKTKMAESKLAKFKHCRIQDGCHHQVESESMSEVFFCKWWEPILASVSEFERKSKDGWIQDSRIQDGRIQDGCHHQVRSDWISLSQSANRRRVFLSESERRWQRCLNPEMAVFLIQHGRIQDGCHHQIESEWTSWSFLCKMAESKMAESQSMDGRI